MATGENDQKKKYCEEENTARKRERERKREGEKERERESRGGIR